MPLWNLSVLVTVQPDVIARTHIAGCRYVWGKKRARFVVSDAAKFAESRLPAATALRRVRCVPDYERMLKFLGRAVFARSNPHARLGDCFIAKDAPLLKIDVCSAARSAVCGVPL